MTYCEEVGLKVGDRIQYLGDNRGSRHSVFNYGDVITLVEDLVSENCLFSKDLHDRFYFDLENRDWGKMIDEPTTITKDTIVNVELTMEELFLIHTTVGNTSQFGKLANDLYKKVHTLLPLRDDMDCFYSDGGLVMDNSYTKWVDSHFMSPAKAQALLLRKQAEELIKQAEELEGK